MTAKPAAPRRDSGDSMHTKYHALKNARTLSCAQFGAPAAIPHSAHTAAQDPGWKPACFMQCRLPFTTATNAFDTAPVFASPSRKSNAGRSAMFPVDMNTDLAIPLWHQIFAPERIDAQPARSQNKWSILSSAYAAEPPIYAPRSPIAATALHCDGSKSGV